MAGSGRFSGEGGLVSVAAQETERERGEWAVMACFICSFLPCMKNERSRGPSGPGKSITTLSSLFSFFHFSSVRSVPFPLLFVHLIPPPLCYPKHRNYLSKYIPS